MKPGAIVVCLPCPIHVSVIPFIKWLPEMNEETPYMLRDIMETGSGNIGVVFEEGVIGYTNNGEVLFPIEYVREILPAAEIAEEIKDVIHEDQLIPVY